MEQKHVDTELHEAETLGRRVRLSSGEIALSVALTVAAGALFVTASKSNNGGTPGSTESVASIIGPAPKVE